jgi:CBS domain containing-hemolysin-like protein
MSIEKGVTPGPDSQSSANTKLRAFLKTILLPIFVWILIWLLFHNYFYLQWGLVWPNWHYRLPILLAVLALLSGLFCCLEMAIANTSPKTLDDWLSPYKDLPDNEFTKYHIIWKRHVDIVKDNEIYNPVIVLINDILNVGLAVVCILATDGSVTQFPATVPSLPFFGEIDISPLAREFANNNLLPGASGFVTIGVTLITLFASEAIPKKIAMRYSPGVLFALSGVIGFLDLIKVRQVCTWGIFMPLEWLFQLIEGFKE